VQVHRHCAEIWQQRAKLHTNNQPLCTRTRTSKEGYNYDYWQLTLRGIHTCNANCKNIHDLPHTTNKHLCPWYCYYYYYNYNIYHYSQCIKFTATHHHNCCLSLHKSLGIMEAMYGYIGSIIWHVSIQISCSFKLLSWYNDREYFFPNSANKVL